MKLDKLAIRSDVLRFGIESRRLKSCLRTRWERPMADEQRRLLVVQRKLTELFVLMAALRGRLHVTAPPREWAGSWSAEAYRDRIVAGCAPAYERPLPTLEMVP